MKTLRLRLQIQGAVQGVGFRPFVFKLANEMGLHGWVNNTSEGVVIEVEGEQELLENFISKIYSDKPVHSSIQCLEPTYLDPKNYKSFEILESEEKNKSAVIMPDISMCNDCCEEIQDPGNRRYMYPFTNCTHCGPRFSIIKSLPYDRANTTMSNFKMCEECENEYLDPNDRRFHAQPNACPKCGPSLELWDNNGEVVSGKMNAIRMAANIIRDGGIIAIKGLGGFQFLVDARDEAAVKRLRKRKQREMKPFAVMYASIDEVQKACHLNLIEERAICSAHRPIVLLKKKGNVLAQSVAPNNPYLGVMLPYTPLHYLLLNELKVPIVATSGNLSEEPICIDEREAVKDLGKIADCFLIHNRPIERHVDDSIVQIVKGREQVLRRARGYAPLPFLQDISCEPILAVGPHLKNTISISHGSKVFVSQHIGNLDTEKSFNAFKNTISDLSSIYDNQPIIVAHDKHPEYFSTKYARDMTIKNIPVQHHYAHILSCMADNQLLSPVLGICWDGTGYGDDETIWGGEFLIVDEHDFKRIGHFETFALPGGEAAIKEPRRSALAILYKMFGNDLYSLRNISSFDSFNPGDAKTLLTMLDQNVNSPKTSSVGRVFDAVSSMIGVCHISKFEGQAAMELEFAIQDYVTNDVYPFDINPEEYGVVVKYKNLFLALLEDINQNIKFSIISAKFHNTLVEIIVSIAKEVKCKKVALSGGCFQNRYLTERTINRLTDEGFNPYWHQRFPPNDGGISLGQIIAVQRELQK